MKNAISINAILFLIFFLFLSSCYTPQPVSEAKARQILAQASEIDICEILITSPNNKFAKIMEEEIISRNIDCNRYLGIIQMRRQSTNNSGVDWGRVADVFGKMNRNNQQNYPSTNSNPTNRRVCHNNGYTIVCQDR